MFEAIRLFLEPLLDLLQVLKLCRFAVLTLLLAGICLIWTPQGREALIRLQTLEDGWLIQNAFFVVAVSVWAVTVWYWSRVILSFRFPDWPPTVPPARAQLIQYYNRVIPRLLAIAAILIVAIGFYSSIDGRQATGPVLRNSGFYLFMAALFGLVTVRWRVWINRARRKHPGLRRVISKPIPRPDPLLKDLFNSYHDLPKGTRRQLTIWIVLLFGVPFVLFQTRCLNLQIAPVLGPATILLLAAASWVPLGTPLVYWGKWHRLPILTLLFLYATVISTCNDNHAVRTLPAGTTAQFEKVSAKQRFNSWLQSRVEESIEHHEAGPIPVFFVASQGGGIRAAYWTTAVLTRIQADQPTFGKHVFVVSGVSGGSLGAAVFAGLLAGVGDADRCGRSSNFPDCASDFLRKDYLASTLGTMLYPDLLQRFLFWPVPYWDRARTLEMNWERAWSEIVDARTNLFEQPFEHLWSARQSGGLPNLVLNMTSVETGQRVLFTNLRVSDGPETECVESWTRKAVGIFDDVIDLSGAINVRRCDGSAGSQERLTLRLSTAVNSSSRFSFFSPAGTVNDRLHVVDGGYFENSALTSLVEVYGAVRPTIDEWNARPGEAMKVIPILLYISNEPAIVTLGVRYLGPLASELSAASPECIRVQIQGAIPDELRGYQGRCPSAPRPVQQEVSLEAEKTVREKLKEERHYTLRLDRDNRATKVVEHHPTPLDEIVAPIETMFRVQDARGQHAYMREQRTAGADPGPLHSRFLRFELRESAANLPLGWTLSTESVKEMKLQLNRKFDACSSRTALTLMDYVETCWPR